MEGAPGCRKVRDEPCVASWEALVAALIEGRGDLLDGRGASLRPARRRPWRSRLASSVFAERHGGHDAEAETRREALAQLRALKVGADQRRTSARGAAGRGSRSRPVDDGVRTGEPAGGLDARDASGAPPSMGIEDAVRGGRRPDPARRIGLSWDPRARLAVARAEVRTPALRRGRGLHGPSPTAARAPSRRARARPSSCRARMRASRRWRSSQRPAGGLSPPRARRLSA